MPELEWISVKGFKSISSIEMLKLGAINVVIGANGSGKSNFIGANYDIDRSKLQLLNRGDALETFDADPVEFRHLGKSRPLLDGYQSCDCRDGSVR